MEAPTVEFAKELLSYIPKDCNNDYDIYINVIAALANTFDRETATMLVELWCPDKNVDTAKRSYDYKVQRAKPGVGFGSLIYIAKSFGFRRTKLNATNRYYREFSSRANKDIVPKKPVNFNDVIPNLKFNEEGERVFRLSVNDKILNKNLNKVTRLPNENFWIMNNEFENVELTSRQLVYKIGMGHAICCSTMESDSNGKISRNIEKWSSAELFAIDIDGNMTVQECLKKDETASALILYTTPSHQKDKHRFRLIFHIPYFETNIERYRKIIQAYIELYGSDRQTSSPVNIFYGNDNAFVYLIQIRETLQFRNGKIIQRHFKRMDNLSKPVHSKIKNETITATPSNNFPAEYWFEVNYLNGKTFYVKDTDKRNLSEYYRNLGILINTINPIEIDDTGRIIKKNDNVSGRRVA